MDGQVGYRKPPLHSRFRKGQSGNPGGRPGPRRLMERKMEARFESLLRLSPEAFRAHVPTDALDAFAKAFTRAAATGDPASVRRVISFLSVRSRRRPRRARLPKHLRLALEAAAAEATRAMQPQSQGISAKKCGAAHPTQGVSRGRFRSPERRRERSQGVSTLDFRPRAPRECPNRPRNGMAVRTRAPPRAVTETRARCGAHGSLLMMDRAAKAGAGRA